MTSNALSVPKNIWLAALAGFTILFIGLFLIHHVTLSKKDIVATGFLFDIIVTFPVIYYFLVIRPLKLRKWGIVLVFTLCCLIAYLVLPAHQRSYIIQLRKLTVVPELGMLFYLTGKARKIRAEYRRLQATFPDIAYNLYKSMETVLGNKLYVKIVASEITVLRFGLLCWKKQKPMPVEAKKYTTYKESGYIVLFGVILFASMVEITALHLVLLHYSKTAALIISILSVYGAIFIVSDISAILKNPVLLMDDKLLLRSGLRWRVMADKNDIASIKKIKEDFEPDGNHFKGAVLKNAANVMITFKQPVTIERLYRKPLSADKIIMSIDKADDLAAEFRR